MSPFSSIFSRLIALHLIAIIGAAILMPFALHQFLSSVASKLQKSSLSDTAQTIARYLSIDDAGKLHLDLPPDLRVLYSPAYGRYAFAVADSSGAILLSSTPTQRLAVLKEQLTQTPLYLNDGRDDGLFFLCIAPAMIGATRVWIQVAEDPEHRDVVIDDIFRSFFSHVAWVTIPILMGLLLIDLLIFRRALRPISQASEDAGKISPEHSDLRLRTENMPREIRPLVHAVNHALDRLEDGYRAQRGFAADVAHELRTPLAILRARIDTLQNEPDVVVFRRDIERMTRIVTQLLDMAETTRFRLADSETADLKVVAADVIEMLAPVAIAQGKELCLSTGDGGAVIAGNYEMLTCAVRNLVENAITNSPKGAEVEVCVCDDGTLSVRDRGAGIAEEDRSAIFDRFWRRDRGNGAGAGLGLAIVQRIVAAHSGEIGVSAREGGGTSFILRFGLAASV